MRVSSIGVGDVVRALAELKPRDEASRRAIVRALGFELQDLQGRFEDIDEKEERKWEGEKLPIRERDQEVTVQPGVPVGLRERRFRLNRGTEKASNPPLRLLAPQASVPLPPSGPEDAPPSLPWKPLFNPQWSRAMISTMARIRTPAGPPDVETLVNFAAERKPMFTMPATMLETASGVDVLLDIGDNMTVFSRDQESLLELIQRVQGAGCVSVLRFQGSPTRGVMSQLSFELQPYRPPPAGWPVVLLTDLGIGAGISAAPSYEWRQFAHLVHGAGCQLLALVPYPLARWPTGILSAMDVLQWDRGTSVRKIRAALIHARRSSR